MDDHNSRKLTFATASSSKIEFCDVRIGIEEEKREALSCRTSRAIPAVSEGGGPTKMPVALVDLLAAHQLKEAIHGRARARFV